MSNFAEYQAAADNSGATFGPPRALSPNDMNVDNTGASSGSVFPPAAPVVSEHVARSVGTSPTKADMVGWTEISHAALWAGFNSSNVPLLNSLLEFMYLEPSTPLTSFGATDAQGWTDDLAEWKFNGNTTRSTQRALAERLAHAARVCTGYEKPYAEKLLEEKNQELFDNSIRWAEANQHPLIQQAPAVVQGETGPTLPQYACTRRIKMNEVADTNRDDLINVCTMQGVKECISHWQKIHRTIKQPPPEIEPSQEQLGVFYMYLLTWAIPYFDFAIFGPFFNRTLCNIMRVGLTWSPDGLLIRHPFKGPPSHEYWTACWNVFGCGMEMWDMADPMTMSDYGKFILGLALEYGRACWAQIYQADVRMRRERILHIWRECISTLEEIADLESRGERYYGYFNPHLFNAKRPWNRVFQLAIDSVYSRDFWEKHVHRPCLHINAKIAYANTFLDGDVLIAADSQQHYATGCIAQETAGIFDYNGTQRGAPAKATKVKADKESRTDLRKQHQHQPPPNNSYPHTTNKKNITLCSAFQTNACGKVCPHSQAH
jgi:hypothetical protein